MSNKKSDSDSLFDSIEKKGGKLFIVGLILFLLYGLYLISTEGCSFDSGDEEVKAEFNQKFDAQEFRFGHVDVPLVNTGDHIIIENQSEFDVQECVVTLNPSKKATALLARGIGLYEGFSCESFTLPSHSEKRLDISEFVHVDDGEIFSFSTHKFKEAVFHLKIEYKGGIFYRNLEFKDQ